MKLSREERETIIRISEAEEMWDIYTSSAPMMRKLEKLAKSTEVMQDEEGIYAKCYLLARSCLSFRKPRTLSEEEKVKRAATLKKTLATITSKR